MPRQSTLRRHRARCCWCLGSRVTSTLNPGLNGRENEMAYLPFLERNIIPTFLDADSISTGQIEFDPGKCTNCGICEDCCPIGTIVVPETGLPYVHEAGA